MSPIIPFLWRPKAAVVSSGIEFVQATDLPSQNTQNYSASVSGPASGSNLLLACGIETYVNSSDVVTTVTYGGVALTRITNGYVAQPTGNAVYFYYLLGPPTGTQTLAISISGGSNRTIVGVPAFYSGVKQSGQPDAGGSALGQSGISSISRTITTVANNAWVLAYAMNDTTTLLPNTGSTQRILSDSRGWFDAGPVSPAGNQAVGAKTSSGVNAGMAIIAASFAPA